MTHDLLRSRGLKDTHPRRAVLDALGGGRVLSPQAISEAARSLNLVTVYRVLAAFEKVRIIHRHPCSGEYSLCAMPGEEGHHGFLHCSSCGRVQEFRSPELCEAEEKAARAARFRASDHVSEIIGTCAACRR